MAKLKVGIIVGSNRAESINKKLAKALEKAGAARCECKVLQVDDLPIFNQDHEKDPPPQVLRFKSEIEACEALLFITPEHNRSITALMKNAIDWGSRPPTRNSWSGRPAAIAGTSGGAISSAAAQLDLRKILGTLGLFLLGQPEMYIHFLPDLINDQGEVSVPKTKEYFEKFMNTFADFAEKIRPH